MKTRRIFLEAIGIIFSLLGAFLLVSSLMPLINPGFVEVSEQRDSTMLFSDYFLLIVSLGMLSGGIFFSQRAIKLKKGEASLDKKYAENAKTKN